MANIWALNERFLKKRYLPLHLLHLDDVLNHTIPWTSVTSYQCTDDRTNKTENNISKSIQISIDCRHRLQPQKIKGGRNNYIKHIYQTNQEDWRHKGPDQTIREGNPTAVNKIEDEEEFLELITLKKNVHEKKDARFTKYLQITVNVARYAFICDVR